MPPSLIFLLFLRLCFFWSLYQPLVSDCPRNTTSQICQLSHQHSVPGAGLSLVLLLSLPLTCPQLGPHVEMQTKSTKSPLNVSHRLPPSTACDVCAASRVPLSPGTE